MTSVSVTRPSLGVISSFQCRLWTAASRKDQFRPTRSISTSVSVETTIEEDALPPRLPEAAEKLPFTLKEIRQAIPPHCFQPNIWRSFSYLLGDLAAISILGCLGSAIDGLPVAMAIKYGLLWPAYWFWVGAFGAGLWVVAHECGHGAFSKNERLNDIVGFFCHSALMVPYFSWKHSHRRHHANTARMDGDEAFVPAAFDAVQDKETYFDVYKQKSILGRSISLMLMLVFGFPAYLVTHLGGRPYKGWPNHYNPWSPVFAPKERWSILLSDIGLLTAVGILTYFGIHHGFGAVFKMYIVPYFVVHFWVVLFTFLHHTHPECPHYDDKEWTFLKGAVSTIDRDFGFLNVIFHRITDTHVLHHLFSQIPHYHALEATEAIKPVMGDYYKADPRPLFRALWEDFRDTKYVAPDKQGEGVLWYRG